MLVFLVPDGQNFCHGYGTPQEMPLGLARFPVILRYPNVTSTSDYLPTFVSLLQSPRFLRKQISFSYANICKDLQKVGQSLLSRSSLITFQHLLAGLEQSIEEPDSNTVPVGFLVSFIDQSARLEFNLCRLDKRTVLYIISSLDSHSPEFERQIAKLVQQIQVNLFPKDLFKPLSK